MNRPLMAALAVALAACGPPRSQPRPQDGVAPPGRSPVRLAIVGTNDLHGWVFPHEETMADGEVLAWGGSAAFAGQLAILRARFPDGVVLLDAGDLFTGTLATDLFEGAPVIAAYRALGYDAVAVGNHDFDFGPAGTRSIPGPGDDPLGALKARAAEAPFPFLARNVYEAGGKRRPAPFDEEGLRIVERQGVRIGVVGLSTPSTPRTSNPANLVGLRFAPLKSEALKAAETLRARGADIVVAVIHEGGSCPRLKNPRSLYGCATDGALIPLIESLPPGTFDVVIGGHTHRPIGHFVESTAVIETTGQGAAFGVVELAFDPDRRRLIPEETRIRAMLPICARFFEGTERCDPDAWRPNRPTLPARLDGREVIPDATVEALLAPFQRRANEQIQRPTGAILARPLDRDGATDTPLGTAFADALREAAHADAALVNLGGFRADLAAGPLSYGALFEAYPFDNALSTLDLTGAELVELIETYLEDSRTPPQLSGLRVEASHSGGTWSVDRATLSDNSPIDPARRYRLATIDFLASGGGPFRAFIPRIPADHIDLGAERAVTARDAFAAWLKANGPTLKPLETPRLALRGERRRRRGASDRSERKPWH